VEYVCILLYPEAGVRKFFRSTGVCLCRSVLVPVFVCMFQRILLQRGD
jgi:hypothetical protein